MNKIRIWGAVALISVWLALAGLAWLLPSRAASDTERRPLAQFPTLSADTLLDGSFMSDFETYTLDQFPFRDPFRSLKSLVHYYGLGQKDNNGIYLSGGYAAALEYPLSTASVDNALEKFSRIYEKYLQGSKVYLAVAPDKSYYLATQNGYPAMDYTALFQQLRQGMPWAEYVDLTDTLGIDAYYRTDTHWRQEKLLPAAQVLSQAMGLTIPKAADFTVTQVEQPFYGVYYGQAALPMPADTIYLLESSLLSDCRVYNHEKGTWGPVYDLVRLTGKDPYEVFLSGPQSLLTIENPNAGTNRELIVFRDSFGSSLVPLLVQDYETVTLVDIRYLSSALLDRFVDFHGQDVLFLYSTLVLNNSAALK